jgi:hypothetical protein
VAVADRIELASAFTALAVGYIILAWLLWRSAGFADFVPSEPPAGPTPVLENLAPVAAVTPSAHEVDALPRDPVTGRVVRQFDL